MMVDLLFVPAVERVLAVFHCEPLVLYGTPTAATQSLSSLLQPVPRYLYAAPYIVCESSIHTALTRTAIVMLIVEVIAIPAFFELLLYYRPQSQLTIAAALADKLSKPIDHATTAASLDDHAPATTVNSQPASTANDVSTATAHPQWRRYINGGMCVCIVVVELAQHECVIWTPVCSLFCVHGLCQHFCIPVCDQNSPGGMSACWCHADSCWSPLLL